MLLALLMVLLVALLAPLTVLTAPVLSTGKRVSYQGGIDNKAKHKKKQTGFGLVLNPKRTNLVFKTILRKCVNKQIQL